MRNDSISRFSMSPQANIPRSTFNRDSTYKSTFDAGKLVPFYCDEVYPGDTFSMDTALLCRMATPIFPVMDSAYLDYYFFFVPNRLTWSNWGKFNGNANPNAWENPVDLQTPSVDLSEDQAWLSEYLDYFGVPQFANGLVSERINCLPFRAYKLIWNEFFRDENLMEAQLVNMDDYDTIDNYQDLLPVCKFHDYFTSCLPMPQKGGAVPFVGTLPVVTRSEEFFPEYEATYALRLANEDRLPMDGYFLTLTGDNGNSSNLSAKYDDTSGSSSIVYPTNLFANVESAAWNTINALRQAFAVQRLLEKDARSGSRYTELLRQHFGVVSPDARLQRPEYLGGKRIPITVNQVIQQSATQEGSTPQGNVAAFSKTVDKSGSFTKSFVEHGFIIGVMCVRTDHTYQQGINRMWSRRERFDYYWPSLAHIGEQPVYNREIYFSDDGKNGEIFGYQEAYADLRYKPSIVTGKFRSYVEGSLDSWHYADYYTSRPYLSSAWIAETKNNIDRTIAVPSEPQFIIDMYFDCKATRPMPLYSVPGLVDHY